MNKEYSIVKTRCLTQERQQYIFKKWKSMINIKILWKKQTNSLSCCITALHRPCVKWVNTEMWLWCLSYDQEWQSFFKKESILGRISTVKDFPEMYLLPRTTESWAETGTRESSIPEDKNNERAILILKISLQVKTVW